MKRLFITAFALLGITVCSFAQVKEKEKTKTITPSQKVVTKQITKNDANATTMKPAATSKTTVAKPVVTTTTATTKPAPARPATAKATTVKTTTVKPASTVKKDGTPDMRFKANKDAAKAKTETADASKTHAAANTTKTKTKTVKKTK